MIKPTELRIGNKFLGAGMVQTVFEIIDNTDRGKIKQEGYEKLITCEENKNQYKPVECEGILLTEEWLVNFGFEKGNNKIINDHFFSKSFHRSLICVNPENGVLVLNNDNSLNSDDIKLGIEVKYVHQLQNLYYALTNKELIFYLNT